MDNLEDLKKLEIYKNTFIKLKSTNKKVITEYPVILDNPCGIIFRLAFPFYINIKGLSLVIESIKDKIYYFEVNL